jgi:hypothetical protein
MVEATDADDARTADDEQPEPITVREVESIAAEGRYRDLLDDSLTNVAEMADSGADATAARAVKRRTATVYAPESIAEAEALVAAAEYALRGAYADDAATAEAIRRVRDEAEAIAEGLRAGAEAYAHDDRSDDPLDRRVRDYDADAGVDRGEGVETDGGRARTNDRAIDYPFRRTAIKQERADEAGPVAVPADACGGVAAAADRAEPSATTLLGRVRRWALDWEVDCRVEASRSGSSIAVNVYLDGAAPPTALDDAPGRVGVSGSSPCGTRLDVWPAED